MKTKKSVLVKAKRRQSVGRYTLTDIARELGVGLTTLHYHRQCGNLPVPSINDQYYSFDQVEQIKQFWEQND